MKSLLWKYRWKALSCNFSPERPAGYSQCALIIENIMHVVPSAFLWFVLPFSKVHLLQSRQAFFNECCSHRHQTAVSYFLMTSTHAVVCIITVPFHTKLLTAVFQNTSENSLLLIYVFCLLHPPKCLGIFNDNNIAFPETLCLLLQHIMRARRIDSGPFQMKLSPTGNSCVTVFHLRSWCEFCI